FVRHRPLWPAMLVWLLWQFSPCSATPLLFFLTERLGATSDQYGLFMGLFYMSLMPAPIAYGFLCKRIRFSQLLFCSTFLAIPQAIPLLFLRTPPQSLFLAPLLGLLGGLPTCAYYELLLRSSPKGLEGAAMMMSSTVLFLAIRFGDIFGSWLYGRGGFGLAAWVTTGVYAIIPLVLAFVPRSLIAYTDGSHSP
ncbi:MAG: MFS transporter, partial [Polyangiaceae bacterium]